MEAIDIKTTEDRTIINLKEIGFKNILALGHYNYKFAKSRLEEHSHYQIIEICFLDKGSQYYNVNNEDYLLSGGDLLITYPGEPHGTSSFPEEKGSLYWMLIQVPDKNGRILNLTSANTKILINRLFSLSSRHFKGLPGIKNMLSNIFRAYYSANESLKIVEINSYIMAFLLTVIHSGEKEDKKKISNEMNLVCRHVQANLHEDLKIEALAAFANLSVSRFKHRFKEEIGMPPKEFMIREKIRKAKELICNNETAINEIAYGLGFSSSSYFATVFKRYTLQTPTEFKLGNLDIGNNY